MYRYAWLHIPTGTEGQREIECLDRLTFLTLLAQWNRIGKNWKYWEIGGQNEAGIHHEAASTNFWSPSL